MNNKTIVATLVAMAPLGALAEPTDVSGFYLGAGVTNGSVDIPKDIAEFSDETGFNLHGGYRFNNHLAAEVRYADVGDFDGISAFGKVSTDVSKDWSAYGIAGMSELSYDTGVYDLHAKDSSFSYGVGVSYNFKNDFSTSLEYLRPYDESTDGVNVSVDTITLNFTKRF